MSSAEKSAKHQILDLVREMPDKNSYDEILRELAFVRMVDRGLVDAGRNRVIDSTALKERFRSWQS
ncbi:MAG: hypothetical protein AAF657_12970 [Acidobacteriota bacterium]